MRLIDGDKVRKAIKKIQRKSEFRRLSNERLLDIITSTIATAPTVDAIPIDWIKKYTKENRLYQSDDFDLYISDMIADWAEREEE